MQNCHIKHTPLFSIKYGGKYIFTLMTLNVQIKVSTLFQPLNGLAPSFHHFRSLNVPWWKAEPWSWIKKKKVWKSFSWQQCQGLLDEVWSLDLTIHWCVRVIGELRDFNHPLWESAKCRGLWDNFLENTSSVWRGPEEKEKSSSSDWAHHDRVGFFQSVSGADSENYWWFVNFHWEL